MSQINEEICPCVGVQMFTPDLVRACCVIKDRGHTCSVFKVKPFNECPSYKFKIDIGDLKK